MRYYGWWETAAGIASKRCNGKTIDEQVVLANQDRPSWNFVNDRNPVVSAATARECHESDLIQRQRNLVGGNVVLDVVRNALPERLDREAEQSALDRNAVPG